MKFNGKRNSNTKKRKMTGFRYRNKTRTGKKIIAGRRKRRRAI